jgi:hypothetical protein
VRILLNQSVGFEDAPVLGSRLAVDGTAILSLEKELGLG